MSVQPNKKVLDAIKRGTHFEAFAMIVDINGFTEIVKKGEEEFGTLADFIRDILVGGVQVVEKTTGIVAGFMGDAFLAFFADSEKVLESCAGIANELDKACEYISAHSDFYPHCPKGPQLKIGIEYGLIDVSRMTSDFLGTQHLFIGSAINYASRILSGGEGNRCLFGPKALANGLDAWGYDGPYTVEGKKGEGDYVYYNLDLDDIWRNHPTETSWR